MYLGRNPKPEKSCPGASLPLPSAAQRPLLSRSFLPDGAFLPQPPPLPSLASGSLLSRLL